MYIPMWSEPFHMNWIASPVGVAPKKKKKKIGDHIEAWGFMPLHIYVCVYICTYACTWYVCVCINLKLYDDQENVQINYMV